MADTLSPGRCLTDASVVALVAVVPAIASSWYQFAMPAFDGSYSVGLPDFLWGELSLTAGAVGWIALALYVVGLEKDGLRRLGFAVLPRWVDGGWGVLLYVATLAAWWIGIPIMDWIDAWSGAGGEWAESGGSYIGWQRLVAWLAIIGTALSNGTGEEAVRVVLLDRLKGAGMRTPGQQLLAVLVVAALFAVYHTYQGLGNAFAVFPFGVILGLFYVATGRFWPIMVAHMLADIVPFIGEL